MLLVAAVAALVMANRPDASATEVRAALLAGADQLDNLQGIVSGGRRLNAEGALLAETDPAGTVLALLDRAGACHGFGRVRPCLLSDGEGWRLGPLVADGPAAARALLDNTELSARDIVEKALSIAADICIYTNHNRTIEQLDF